MLGELREILDAAGLGLGDDELLDALWLSTRLPQGRDAPLARYLRRAAGSDETGSTPAPSGSDVPPKDESSSLAPARRASGASQRRHTAGTTAARALAPVTGSPSPTAPSSRVLLLPGAKVLGNELVLGRALRPLKRRVPSAFRSELDEDATAASQADTGIPNVILRAIPERWLRLALVIDSDVSMVLWERHCRELQTVLEQSGAFRQIEVHQLCYSAPQQDRAPDQRHVFLVRPWDGRRASTLPTSALIDPSGRTLVMVITDGAAPAWLDGRIHAELERWALAGPTAVLHVLPRHFWAGTGVAGDTWHITAPRPGAPNSAWQVTDPVLPPNLSSFTRVPVPVVELTPPGLRSWATAITTVGRPVPMCLWEPQPSLVPRPAISPSTEAPAFTRSASPTAVRLAAHIAAVAPVTVPVMRLVQSHLPIQTDTAALAEIFLSGLLQQVARPGQEGLQGPMKHRLFDFTAEAKDLLLDAVPLAELISSSRRVGERIEQLVGRSPDFPAWLVPSSTQQAGSPAPFAHIGRALLTRLGLDEEEDLLDEDEGHHHRLESKAPPPRNSTVIILTALALEYEAVLAHLTDSQTLTHPRYGTRVKRGWLPGTPWQVDVVHLGEGNLTAATLTERVLTWLDPEAVLLVGVTGGLKGDVEIGDVVVATKVYSIHGGKQTPDGFLVQPEAWQASQRLEQSARDALGDTTDFKAYFEPIVLSDVILADRKTELAQHIRTHYDDAVAIEMESAGVIHAVHLADETGALIVRGISDKADPDKFVEDKARSQARAATNAAAAAVAILRELAPNPTPQRDSTPAPILRIPKEDATLIRTTYGVEVVDELLRQGAEHGWSMLRLGRPSSTISSSHTGPMLLLVEVSPPFQQLVIKVTPAREASAHALALDAVPTFSRVHLVGQPYPPSELSDGRTLMFQEAVGGSLLDVTPAGSLAREEQNQVIQAVVRGLLAEWNDAARREVPERTTMSEFLRRELDDAWTGGGSLQAFGQDLGVLEPAPPWLYSDGMRLPNPYLLVKGGHPSLADPTVPVLRGFSHGDLHLDNILVPRPGDVLEPHAYRLIDLCTFSRRADLGRDVATLLLSALLPYVDHPNELPPGQRHALLRFVVDPDASHRADIVPGAAAQVAAVRDTAREVMRAWGDPWDLQFLLSLMAGALRFSSYTQIGEAGRTWFVRLAAHAGGEVLARTHEKNAGARPSVVEPGRDSFTMAGFGHTGAAGRDRQTGFVPDQEPRHRRWQTETAVRDDRAVVGFGPDHTVVVVDSEGGIRRWTVSGDPLPGTSGRSPRQRLGHQSLVASLTHSVVVARPKELEIVHFPQRGGAFRSPSVPLQNGDHFLVTSGGDVFATHDTKHLTVRDYEDGAPIESLPCPPSMAASAVSIDASVVAMARSREVHIHRRGRPPLRRSVANSIPHLRSKVLQMATPDPGLQLAVSPSGSHVGCVTFEEVVVWSTDDGREVYRRKLTDREADEALGATWMRLICTETGTLFWLRRGRLSSPTIDGGTQLRQSGIYADFAISRDGTLIAMLSTDGRLGVWEM